MTTTAPAELEPEHDLSRLARRALAAAQLAGCSTPPTYVATLSRAELFALLDSADTTAGEA